MKVICQSLVLVNFALQKLKFTTVNEIRVEEGKEDKGAPVKVYFIFIVTTV